MANLQNCIFIFYLTRSVPHNTGYRTECRIAYEPYNKLRWRGRDHKWPNMKYDSFSRHMPWGVNKSTKALRLPGLLPKRLKQKLQNMNWEIYHLIPTFKKCSFKQIYRSRYQNLHLETTFMLDHWQEIDWQGKVFDMN